MWQNYEKVIDPLPRSGEFKKKKPKLNSFDHFDETQIDKECNYEKPAKKKKAADEPTLPQHNRSQMQLDTNAPNKVA